ncbi:MAG: class I SAM-dependent methyltransferase [bacterium]
MKTIYSITMVKNEIDIIETFIRYNLNFLDKMVILDNGSTDGTLEVILELIREGLPIDLVFDHNPAYIQAEIITSLMYDTIEKYNPDFILPLDADEFITTYKNVDIKKMIASFPEDSLTYLSWVTYVPTFKDNLDETNILRRIRYRRSVQHNYDEKVMIPAVLANKQKVTIKQGSHDLNKIDGVTWKKHSVKTISLAHYPVRSVHQMKSKYLVGWLANLARPEQVLFDWYYYYNIIKGGKDFTVKDLTLLALYYDVIDKNQEIGVIEDPINLKGLNDMSLRYSQQFSIDVMRNILNYTENLAREYSLLRHQVDDKELKEYITDEMILPRIKDFLLIEGWLSVKEACELYRTARSLSAKKLSVAEIGSWLGRSSYVLTRAIEDKHDSCLHCIDAFDGSGDATSKELYREEQKKLGGDNPLLKKFKINMKKAGVLSHIKIHKGYSFNVSKKFETKLDFLFIDGNHDYESVLKDYLQWSPLIKKGGYIAFHDVGSSHTIGPKQVVEQKIVGNPMWINQKLVDELYVAQKAE